MKMNLSYKVELKYHLLCYFFLILSCDNPAVLYHYFIVKYMRIYFLTYDSYLPSSFTSFLRPRMTYPSFCISEIFAVAVGMVGN